MKQPVVIPFAAFRTLLLGIVTDTPAGHRYESNWGCFYYHIENRGRCIIGEALFRLGADEEWLKDQSSASVVPNSARAVLSRLGFDEVTCAYAQVVQDVQDCGNPWSEALRRAKVMLTNNTLPMNPGVSK